ncbi:MAG: hypothetical protein IJH83_00850, partial [Coriobacteriales bacterium]|nr:hypothetical protein [Coriobacteriales bacterium]
MARRRSEEDAPRTRLAWLLDLLVLLLVLALCVAVRLPSFALSGVSEADQDAHRDEQGLIYPTDPDSFLFIRRAAAAALDDDWRLSIARSQDALMSPVNEERDSALGNGMPLAAAAVCKLVGAKDLHDVTLVCYWFSMVAAALAAVPAYLFLRRRGMRWGAVCAGVFCGLAAPFVIHTTAGYFDTDCMLAVLPLSMVCCIGECVLAESRGKQLGWALGAGVALAAIALVWDAWMGYAAVALGLCAALALGAAFPPARGKRGRMLVAAGLCAAFVLLAALICSKGVIVERVADLFAAATGSLSNQAPIYPDASLYVSELRDDPVLAGGWKSLLDVSKAGIVNRLGGIAVLAMAAWALIDLLVGSFRRSAQKPALDDPEGGLSEQGPALEDRSAQKPAPAPAPKLTRDRFESWALILTFGVWLAGTMLMLSKGTRFMQLPVLPVGMLLG